MAVMDIPTGLLPFPLLFFSWVLFALVTLRALLRADWRRLGNNADMHVWLGATVAVMLLWMLKGGVSPGLGFHILGVTTLTLMFGWAFAWFSVVLVVLSTCAYGLGGWEAVGVNALLMGGVPILVTHAMLRLCQWYLPHNFFIYVFINAFFVAGLSSVLGKLVTVTLIVLSGVHTLDAVAYEYLPYLPLMFLSEALVNGMTMTMLVALRPQWVSSFDDNLYLKDK